MKKSNFALYIEQFFPGIVVEVVERLNDTKRPLPYLHRRLLRKEFSVSGKWEALSAAYTRVMADVVAMDSKLPLKKRDAIQRASGDICKIGMKLYLNEQQLTELDTLMAMGTINGNNIRQLVAKLFADTPRVIEGVYERLEHMFLMGLSTGVTVAESTDNTGTGVRLDYGYLPANKFYASTVWSNPAATPFDDIQKVLDKASADGNKIIRVFIDRGTFQNIANTNQAKQLFAFTQGYVGSNIPAPDLEQLNRVAQSRYGFVFEIVDRTVRYEKNGTQTSVKPWATGAVVFTCAETLGTLTYATLAEENHPVEGVQYQKADGFILVSKYGTNDPVAEWSSSQARAVPVISGVDAIYLLDSTQTPTT